MFIKLFTLWIAMLFSIILILHSCFWSREIIIHQGDYDPIQVIDDLLLNGTLATLCADDHFAFCPVDGRIKPVYGQIILQFLDAVGYRYVHARPQDTHPIFTSLKAFQNTSPLQFITKTQNIPPSTDYTIHGLMNGVQQKLNYVDSIFKNKPDRREDSLLNRLHESDYKSLLLSAKKMDWFKMASGMFDRVENSKEFDLNHLTKADMSSFDLYMSQKQSQYIFVVLHLMGFDALGHALGYQNYDKGLEIMDFFQEVSEELQSTIHSDQLLIAMGDHDQSYRGKHYHCSMESNECQGFLFIYTTLRNAFEYIEERPTNISQTFKPVDYGATLHTLMGLPLSFQSIGKVLPEMYPIRESSFTQKLNSYVRILMDQSLSLFSLEKYINFMQIHYQHQDWNYVRELSLRIEKYLLCMQTNSYTIESQSILEEFISLIQKTKDEDSQQDTTAIISRATAQMHNYAYIADKIKENYMFSYPSRLVMSCGVLLLMGCLSTFYFYSRMNLRVFLQTQISGMFTVLLLLTQLIPSQSLIAGWVLTLTRIKVWNLKPSQLVPIIVPIIALKMDSQLQTYDFLLPYVSFVVFFGLKLNILHCNVHQWSGRGIFLIMIVLVSQMLTQVFYSIDMHDYHNRKIMVYAQMVMFVVFIYVNPRYFKGIQKGKTNILYFVLLFMMADLCVIAQFNHLKGWFSFSLIFLVIFQDGELQDQVYQILLKLLTICLIIETIHPLMIPHQQFEGVLTLNMNQLITVVDDFKIIPSLVSMFLGAFGLDITACLLIYFMVREWEVDYESCIALLVIPIRVISIGRVLFVIFSFKHSFDVTAAEWSSLINNLYSLHIVLLQFFIMFTFELVLRWRSWRKLQCKV